MTDEQITQIVETHADTVYRVCYTYFKGSAMDAQDAAQTVFLNMVKCGRAFESEAHEKAWLIVAAGNVCKNMLKRKHRQAIPLEDKHLGTAPPVDETFGLILSLPQDVKMSVYLYYYEGYSAIEIGRMLGKKQSTVWKYLKTGRDMLREALTEEPE